MRAAGVILKDFEAGSWTGRAFSVERTLVREGSLGALASDHPGVGTDEDRFSFCTDQVPHSSDLSDCGHVLAYKTLPGPSLFWIRRDTRSPSKIDVERILSEICDVPIGAMRAPDRDSARERARREAVSRTSPKTKIIPCAAYDDLLWISSRKVYEPLARLVSGVFGPAVKPLFTYSPSGFQASCLASVHLLLGGNPMPGGASIDSVLATVGKGKIRGTLVRDGRLVSVGPALKVALVESDVTFEEVVVSVPFRGGRAAASLDADGPYRVEVPPSQGGVPVDRIARRARDVREVVTRILDSMQSSVPLVG